MGNYNQVHRHAFKNWGKIKFEGYDFKSRGRRYFTGYANGCRDKGKQQVRVGNRNCMGKRKLVGGFGTCELKRWKVSESREGGCR